jgi:hypothetical protein
MQVASQTTSLSSAECPQQHKRYLATQRQGLVCFENAAGAFRRINFDYTSACPYLAWASRVAVPLLYTQLHRCNTGGNIQNAYTDVMKGYRAAQDECA